MKIDRTITKKDLISLGACEEGLERFSIQTEDTGEAVTVTSLIGGENTVGDLIWLAGKLCPQKKLVQFGISCATLVEHINTNPRIRIALEAAKAWLEAPTEENVEAAKAASYSFMTSSSSYLTRSVARAVTNAAAYVVTTASTDAHVYVTAVSRATYDAAYNYSSVFGKEVEDKINQLLRKLFQE